MINLAGLLLAFSPPVEVPPPPVEPTPIVHSSGQTARAPSGGAPSPASPPTPAPSAPASPNLPAPVTLSAARENEADDRKRAKARESRRHRRGTMHGSMRLLGTERANLFQAHVPAEWDATTIINTDRPDFTDALPTVGCRVTYVETGYNWAKGDGRLGDTTILHTAPELLLRYGLHDRVELRFKSTPGLVHDQVSGERRLLAEHAIGLKAEVFRQRGWVPAHTIVPVVTVVNSLEADGGHQIIPEFGWVYGWQVRKWMAFRGSTGIDGAANAFTFGAGPSNGFLELWQSVSVYWHLHRMIGVHTEWGLFGYPLEGIESRRVLGFHTYGLYFYPTQELLIDLRVGDDFKPGDSSWYVGGGISFRFKPRHPTRAKVKHRGKAHSPAHSKVHSKVHSKGWSASNASVAWGDAQTR